ANCAAPSLSRIFTLLPACVSLSKRSCKSCSRSTAISGAHTINKRNTAPALRNPHLVLPLLLSLHRLFKNMNSLSSLPHLVGIPVLIQFQKFSVCLEGGLCLVQFIVTERPDEPCSRARRFLLVDRIHCRQSRQIIPCQIVRGAEVFPVDDVVAVQIQRRLQFLLPARVILFVHVQPPQPSVQLRIGGSQLNGLLQNRNRLICLFLSNQDVRAQLQRFQPGRTCLGQFVQLGKRRIVLLLLQQRMNHALFRGGVAGLYRQIISIRLGGFGLLLQLQALCQPL